MFVPIIMGSDKTTVSVATGDNEFYPLYMSIGNIKNNVCRAHKDALVLIGFLAIAKGQSLPIGKNISNTEVTAPLEEKDSEKFRRFRWQLFHSSLAAIFNTLRAGMTLPEVMKCPDGHYCCVIFGLGPYIADYPEQVLLACIVSGWCGR
jgi:hypothetical protein